MDNNLLHNVNCCDLKLLTGGFEDIADWIIEETLRTKEMPSIISHINVNNYYHLRRTPELKEKLKHESCFLLFDGIGFKAGSYLLGRGYNPDLNGSDLFPLVMKRASALRLKVFLLGAKENTVQLTAKNIQMQFPGVQIVGYYDGYFGSYNEKEILSMINDSKAQILLVGMGFILQENFSLKFQEHLNVMLIWNVGGLFDFVSNIKPRAPLFIRKLRLEWLYRFLLEPKRMCHRNMYVGAWFIGHIFIKIITRNVLNYERK